MIFTIAIIATATFLLPFLSLVNKEYLPEFLIPISQQLSLLLLLDGYKVTNYSSSLIENVTHTDNIIKPTDAETHLTDLAKDKASSGAAAVAAATSGVKQIVEDKLLNNSYVVSGSDYVNEGLDTLGDQAAFIWEWIKESLRQATDNAFYNSYVFPKYQYWRLTSKEYFGTFEDFVVSLLEKHYYTLSEDQQDQVLKGLILIGLALVLLLLYPVLKYTWRFLVKDFREFHDTQKDQFKVKTKKTGKSTIVKSATGKPESKTAGTPTKHKKTKKQKNNDDNDSPNSSLYNSLNEKFPTASTVNEKLISSFKEDAENIKQRVTSSELESRLDKLARTTQLESPIQEKNQEQEKEDLNQPLLHLLSESTTLDERHDGSDTDFDDLLSMSSHEADFTKSKTPVKHRTLSSVSVTTPKSEITTFRLLGNSPSGKIITPSKLLYSSVINNTNGTINDPSYSSIILSSSPNKKYLELTGIAIRNGSDTSIE